MKRAVVIGGGVSGLSAALELQQSGKFAVTLIEQAEQTGGLAISLKHKNLTTDLGPHRINTELPEVGEILRAIAGDRILTVARKSRMYLGGRFVQYPVRPLELLFTLGPLKPARFIASFFWQTLAGKNPRDGSFDGYMIRAFGPALNKFLFRPFIEKTWKERAENLDDAIARVRLTVGGLDKLLKGLLTRSRDVNSTGALKEFLYIRGGVNRIVEVLRERFEAAGGTVRCNTRLIGFELGAGEIAEVLCLRGDGAKEAFAADAIVTTIPLPLLLPCLLRELPHAPAHDALQQLHYLALLLVCVIVKKERISENHWLYFPGRELIFNRAHEAKNFDAALGPQGRTLLCCEVTCRKDDELWNLAESELIARVESDAVKTGLFSRNEIDESFVYKIEWAYPVYHRGFKADLEIIWEYLKNFPNLITTGRQGLYNHNNIDHSIAMGLAAARCLRDQERPAEFWFEEFRKFDQFRIVD